MFKTGFMILSLIFSFNLSALDEPNADTLSDPLVGFQVSKEDIAKSLEVLRAKGTISEADYQKSIKELSGLSNQQITGLTQTAVGMVRNNPEAAEGLVKGNSLDVKEVEKQIKDLSLPKD